MVIKVIKPYNNHFLKGECLMTKIPSMRLSLLALIALGLEIPSSAEPREIHGQTYVLEKNKKNYVDFLSEESVAALATRLLPPCPPAPPPAPVGPNPTQNPNALSGAFFPNASASNSLSSPAQTVASTFVAGDQSINASWVGTPPNTMGCVGPTQFVAAIDPTLTSYTKAGIRDNVFDLQPDSFLNLDGDFNSIADMSNPHIYYDAQSNRWYYIALNDDANSLNKLNNGFSIWVSDSGILSNASKFTVVNIYNATLVPDQNGCAGDQNLFFDFPSLGMDVNALYTSFNMYDASGNYLTTTAFVIQKSSLLTDGPVYVTVFRDVVGVIGKQDPFRGAASVLTPAINFDPNPQFGYYLATDPLLYGKLNVYRVINPGTKNPTLSPATGINVLTTSSTNLANMPFPGNLFGDLGTLHVGDDRIMPSPVIRNGQLYATHTILVDNTGNADTNVADPIARSAARWYQFNLASATETATSVPTLVQAGTLFDNATSANPLWYNMPSLMVNQRGDLVIGFTVSGNTVQPSAGFVGRLAGDPFGVLRIGGTPPNIYAAGGGQYSRLLGQGSPYRPQGQPWGNYSYTSLDPVDQTTFWTIQERTQSSLEQVVVAQLITP